MKKLLICLKNIELVQKVFTELKNDEFFVNGIQEPESAFSTPGWTRHRWAMNEKTAEPAGVPP